MLFRSNYGGILMEEGLTEKCAIDFARKYNLPCKPSYTYHLYGKLVSKIERVLSLENGQLFNTNYRQVLSQIDKSGGLLEQYELAELFRYTSFFQKTKDNVVTFNYNGKTYTSNPFPKFDEKIKKSLSVDSKERISLNNSLDEIKKRKDLLGQYGMILQEIKRRKELEDNSLSKGTQTKSRGVIDIFTCILFTLAISILTFTITYFLLSKHF